MAGTLMTIAYFAQWAIYARKHFVQDIPAAHLSHVLYSFADVRPITGEVFLTDSWADTDQHYPTDSWNDVGHNVYGSAKQLYLLKKRNRRLKTLLSIGGWTYSPHFAPASSTAVKRSKFASSALTLIKDLGFDGIDIDWEYPANATEAQNFTLLLQECRKQLDSYADVGLGGKKLLLSIAAPCGAENYQKLLLKQMEPYLDFINLMAYDFAGAWAPNVAHQANLFPSTSNPASTPHNADTAVRYYLSQSIPANKLVLGMPAYGRSFANTTGPGTPYSGLGGGSWENGVWDYKALPQPGVKVYLDVNIVASWSYDINAGVMVSYDTPDVQKIKTSYIMSKGLGGAMWWETSSDRKVDDPKGSLIKTVVDAMGGVNSPHLDFTQNILTYPDSQYDNIRNGMPNE